MQGRREEFGYTWYRHLRAQSHRPSSKNFSSTYHVWFKGLALQSNGRPSNLLALDQVKDYQLHPRRPFSTVERFRIVSFLALVSCGKYPKPLIPPCKSSRISERHGRLCSKPHKLSVIIPKRSGSASFRTWAAYGSKSFSVPASP